MAESKVPYSVQRVADGIKAMTYRELHDFAEVILAIDIDISGDSGSDTHTRKIAFALLQWAEDVYA